MRIGKLIFTYFNRGNCWRFRFSRRSYFGGTVTRYSFWRFQMTYDRLYHWFN